MIGLLRGGEMEGVITAGGREGKSRRKDRISGDRQLDTHRRTQTDKQRPTDEVKESGGLSERDKLSD